MLENLLIYGDAKPRIGRPDAALTSLTLKYSAFALCLDVK